MLKMINKYFWYAFLCLGLAAGILIARESTAALTRITNGPGFIVYQAATVSSDSTGSSDVFPAERFPSGAVQVVWSTTDASDTATFELQTSVDGNNYVSLSSTSTSTSGTSGSVIYDLQSIPAAKMRLTVTEAGTTNSTLDVYFVGKGSE